MIFKTIQCLRHIHIGPRHVTGPRCVTDIVRHLMHRLVDEGALPEAVQRSQDQTWIDCTEQLIEFQQVRRGGVFLQADIVQSEHPAK